MRPVADNYNEGEEYPEDYRRIKGSDILKSLGIEKTIKNIFRGYSLVEYSCHDCKNDFCSKKRERFPEINITDANIKCPWFILDKSGNNQ